MEDQMRTEIPYAEIAETLKKTLDLKGSPVAVKLAKSPEAIPEGIKPIDDVVRHCQMVSRARLDGEIFYATADKHVCMGGAWALGLKELTKSLRTGEFYFKLGKFESWAACMRTIQQVPHVPELETYATVYAPLEKTPFDPHVVIIVAKPLAMLKLAQATLYRARRADRVLDVGDPVGLCGRDRAALPHRQDQLLPRVRWLTPVLWHRGQRTGHGHPRRDPPRVCPRPHHRHRCSRIGAVTEPPLFSIFTKKPGRMPQLKSGSTHGALLADEPAVRYKAYHPVRSIIHQVVFCGYP